jgi:putative nucleotidyltransferase-like protein
MKFRQNLAFLSLLLKGEHENAAQYVRRGAVQTLAFASFIEKHNLQLQLLFLLNGSPVRKVLPQEWLGELKNFSLNHWVRQERLVRELMQLSTIFAAAGQEFILLKGAYLAKQFFGGIDRRPFFDLDLLIVKDNLPEAMRLLRSSGYVRKSSILFNETLTTYFTHAFDFAKPNVAVDLHWALSANAAQRLDSNAIWAQRQKFLLNNRQFSVLSDEYEVVFSLISIFKDIERGAARLKSFVDLYFILTALETRLDWPAFVENRRRERVERIAVNILSLLLDLFDCRDRFPAAAQVVALEHSLIKNISAEHAAELLEATQGALRNKLWASGAYQCSRFQVFLWWLVSLPFRLLVYDSGKYRRFNSRLQKRISSVRKRVRNRYSRQVL